jgi:transcription elongation factor Elf1
MKVEWGDGLLVDAVDVEIKNRRLYKCTRCGHLHVSDLNVSTNFTCGIVVKGISAGELVAMELRQGHEDCICMNCYSESIGGLAKQINEMAFDFYAGEKK